MREGAPGSHRNKGWEEVTECAIRALAARNKPLVGCYGARMRGVPPRCWNRIRVWSRRIPRRCRRTAGSLVRARSRRVNTLLVEQGAEPVDWTVK